MFAAGVAGNGSVRNDSGVGLMMTTAQNLAVRPLLRRQRRHQASDADNTTTNVFSGLPGGPGLVVGLALALAHPPFAQAQTAGEHTVRQTVECVEPILAPAPTELPPDAEFSQPWHEAYADNTSSQPEPSQQAKAARLPAPIETDYRSAHRFATGAGVRVAVIDTGVFAHEQLTVEPIADLVSPAENDPLHDCDGHGTVVAGIISANQAGVAPDAEILSIRQSSAHYSSNEPGGALDDESGPDNPAAPETSLTGTLGSFAQAIHTALDHDAQVINASVVSCIPPEQAEVLNTEVLDDALARAEAANVPIIAAAGNAGDGCEPDSVVFPGNSDTVITVGAIATPHQHAEYSMPQPEGNAFAAPGRVHVGLSPSSQAWLAGTIRNGQPAALQGTSFAAPVVSGTVALLRERYPHASAAAIRDFLHTAAYPQHGVIDPARVISHPAPVLEPDPTRDTPGTTDDQEAKPRLVAGEVAQAEATVSVRSRVVFAIAIAITAVVFSSCGLRKSRK